jgi:hypothetical protein
MRIAQCLLAFGAATWMPWAAGQATLGAILDAGAKVMSVDEFQQQLVQRIVEGPTPGGGIVEVMYVPNGTVQGRGTPTMNQSMVQGRGTINGEWKPEGANKVCTSLRIGANVSGATVQLPSRCQYWFKLGDKYFLADSDIDRSAKVLLRTVKH